MIRITGLSQSFGKHQVLDNVNLTVEKREVCALVGRNGAGKTTLLHSMLDLIPVKKGTIELCGFSHRQPAWKQKTAYLPEKFQLYPHLSGEENLLFFASLGRQKPNEARVAECLEQVSLSAQAAVRVKDYSKGMLQRLGLAITLYADAELLILDEPTSGLDPLGREEILRILGSLEEKTILFSSHHMDEIKRICSHVAFLEDGILQKYTIAQFTDSLLTGGKRHA